MKRQPARKAGKVDADAWPRKVCVGRATVSVYRRYAPGGQACYLVANYSTGKRRLDACASESDALEHAQKLARQLSRNQVVAASMTNAQAADYASAVECLAPYGVTLPSAASTLADCLKVLGDLSSVLAASKFYCERRKVILKKSVAEVVAELIAVKQARNKSARYVEDLKSRLNRFAEDFKKDIGSVTTPQIQGWLDSLRLSSQSYLNFRRVVHLLFEHAVARGYAADNPVAGTESIDAGGGEVTIYTPGQIAKLLAAASPDFLPCLALGAFAGLRSAEIERLSWEDIDLVDRHIVIGASKAKTASRRVIPVSENLALWLAPFAGGKGQVWKGSHTGFYDAQQVVAEAAGVAWRGNALRHSYASYRFAQTGDAGRVAGELGNSAAIVHKHYRELVKPKDADRWFQLKPDDTKIIVPIGAASTPG